MSWFSLAKDKKKFIKTSVLSKKVFFMRYEEQIITTLQISTNKGLYAFLEKIKGK